MKIRPLPREVVERIAAGEVVERPASVVKELVENALDAGAGRIAVEADKGGKERILVADDGEGMAAEDLAACVLPHATSKIRTSDDLFAVRTLGFRGEALPSIAAVSRLTIQSRPRGAAEGWQLEARGGAVRPVQPCGIPAGTRVEVRGLFFNVPARRKFLRSDATEVSHLDEWIVRFALSHPGIHFSLSRDGEPVYASVPPGPILERIGLLFGRELQDHLIPVEGNEAGLGLAGFASRPGHSVPGGRTQYLFVNGRFVKDRIVFHALRQAYKTLVPKGRGPAAFLFLQVDPSAVDVNVHPMKTEVRFQDGQRVHRLVSGSLRRALEAGGAVVHGTHPEGDGRACAVHEASGPYAVAGGRASGFDPPVPSVEEHPSFPAMEEAALSSPGEAPPAIRCLQMHNLFLVAETPDGIEILDQHALHERVLYDELRGQVDRSRVESQRLLIPEILEFPPQATSALLGARATLSTLGFELEEFGLNTLAVHASPTLLVGRRLREFFALLLDKWEEEEWSVDLSGLREKMVRLVACQAAVRAGDRLDPVEIQTLLARRSEADFPGCCQHGRPTSLKLTLKELEKRFMRR